MSDIVMADIVVAYTVMGRQKPDEYFTAAGRRVRTVSPRAPFCVAPRRMVVLRDALVPVCFALVLHGKYALRPFLRDTRTCVRERERKRSRHQGVGISPVYSI